MNDDHGQLSSGWRTHHYGEAVYLTDGAKRLTIHDRIRSDQAVIDPVNV
jgi:hypothetical protein